jgi:hypothetical protein
VVGDSAGKVDVVQAAKSLKESLKIQRQNDVMIIEAIEMEIRNYFER